MATLYLHIGTCKTGTTAIQLFCVQNREALAKKGYRFMKAPYFYPSIASERNGHFLISAPRNSDGSFSTARAEHEWRGGMEALSKEFAGAPNVILSDEGIWGAASPAFWKDLKAEAQRRGFDVRIVVYLRRQDQFLVSNWAQKVKSPYDAVRGMRFEELLPEADKWFRMDYCAGLEEIAAQFGRDAINVRIYERGRFPDGDVVKDFLSVIGVPDDPNFKPVRDPNSSLYGNALEIKRIINALPGIDAEQERRLERIARACCATGGEEKRSMFSQEECEAFLAKYEDPNRRVARDYLGEENSPLFAPLETLPPKWSPDNPEMYEAIIRFFAIALFARQKERFSLRVRRKLRALRTRLWNLRERILNARESGR